MKFAPNSEALVPRHPKVISLSVVGNRGSILFFIADTRRGAHGSVLSAHIGHPRRGPRFASFGRCGDALRGRLLCRKAVDLTQPSRCTTRSSEWLLREHFVSLVVIAAYVKYSSKADAARPRVCLVLSELGAGRSQVHCVQHATEHGCRRVREGVGPDPAWVPLLAQRGLDRDRGGPVCTRCVTRHGT